MKYVPQKLFKWKLTNDPDDDWDLLWTDSAVTIDMLSKMKLHQKINHFPGMYHLARKNNLGRNLMKLKKEFPEDYNFFPETWNLPTEYNDFKS